jgi:hypothetical protein
MKDIGLGESISSKKQLDEFVAFQDSQNMRMAYLAKTVKLTYNGRNKRWQWGLALGSQAQIP